MQRAPQKDARAPRSLLASYFFMYHPLRLLPPLGFRAAPDRLPTRCSLRAVRLFIVVGVVCLIHLEAESGFLDGNHEVEDRSERDHELFALSLGPTLSLRG